MSKWIGNSIDTSGIYVETECPELKVRQNSNIYQPKIYQFNTRFKEQYLISDKNVIEKIEELLVNHEPMEMYEYLYERIILVFGVMEFVLNMGHLINRSHEEGYKKGKLAKQDEILEVLGLK